MENLRQYRQSTQPIYKELEHIAFHDPLTGLYFIFIELLEEISRTYRQLSSIAVVTGDIDHFKNINDTGHNTGDQVLKKLEGYFKSCRRSDIALIRREERNCLTKYGYRICCHSERIRINTEKSLPLPDETVTISFVYFIKFIYKVGYDSNYPSFCLAMPTKCYIKLRILTQ